MVAEELAQQLERPVSIGADPTTREIVLDVPRHLDDLPVPTLFFPAHRLLGYRHQIGGSRRLQQVDGGRFSLNDLGNDLVGRPALVRPGAGQYLVQHRAERINVGPLVDVLYFPHRLFGRHIGGSSEHTATDGLALLAFLQK